MPFAFLFAPLIAVAILALYLRGQKGSFGEKINEVGYRYESSPLQRVRDRLKEGQWKEEKELFKLMIVFLPISLFVLTFILAVSGQLAVTHTFVDAGLIVFIEDLVAYLASFLAAVYLLYSSKLSFRGKSLGDRIKFSVNNSLLRTGTFIALLSLVAFIAQYSLMWITMSYFIVYYIMMSVIFAILLPFFEPFSSLLFIKLVNFTRGSKLSAKLRSVFSRRSISPIIFGFAVASTAVVMRGLVDLGIAFSSSLSSLAIWYNSTLLPAVSILGSPSFTDELWYIRLFLIFATRDVLEFFVVAYILVWFVRQQNSSITATVLSTAVFSSIYYLVSSIPVAASLIPQSTPLYWFTAAPAIMTAPDFYLPVSRIGTLPVQNSLLGNAELLYLSLSPLLLLLLLSYLIKYRKDPLYLTEKIGEETVTEKAYSRLSVMPSLSDVKSPTKDNVFKYGHPPKKSRTLKDVSPETRDDIKKVTEALGKNMLTGFSNLAGETGVEAKKLYGILRYMVSTGLVEAYGVEFTSVTPRAALQNLYVTTKVGLNIFNYSFGSLTIDPALVSGMLTAITSFIKEATRSKQSLRTIEHGDVVLMIEYGNFVFGTIVADEETPDLRMALRKFVDQFEKKHGAAVANWTGRVEEFDQDKSMVVLIFKQYLNA